MLRNFHDEKQIECGVDEVGLGALIGSLYISSVILPQQCPDSSNTELWNMINDSKQITKNKRERTIEITTQSCA